MSDEPSKEETIEADNDFLSPSDKGERTEVAESEDEVESA